MCALRIACTIRKLCRRRGPRATRWEKDALRVARKRDGACSARSVKNG